MADMRVATLNLNAIDNGNNDLTIYQGSTFKLDIIIQDTDLATIDTESYEWTAEFRLSHSGPLAASATINPEAGGLIHLVIEDDATAAMTGDGVYDIEGTVGLEVQRFVEGTYTLSKEVTQG